MNSYDDPLDGSLENEFASAAKLLKDSEARNVEALAVDPDLSETDLLQLLVHSSDILQRMAVFPLLPRVIANIKDEEEEYALLHDILDAFSVTALQENPLELPEWYFSLFEASTCLKSRLFLVSNMLALARALCIASMYGQMSAKNLNLVRAVIEELENMIELLDEKRDEVFKNILEHVLVEAHPRSLESNPRSLSARLLGTLARCKYIPDGEKSSELLNLACSLCQDIDPDVRSAMCAEIGYIGQAIGEKLFMKTLYREFMLVLDDEESFVRESAILSLHQLGCHLSPNRVLKSVYPKILEAFNDEWGLVSAFDQDLLDEDLIVLYALVSVTGPVIHCLGPLAKTQLADDEPNNFKKLLEVYNALAGAQSSELRRLVVFNYPGILATLGGANYAKYLDPLLQAIAEDPEPSIRLIVASSLHDIIGILGKQRAARYLVNPLLKLFKDPEPQVRQALLEKMPETLDGFSVADHEQRVTLYETLSGPFLNYAFPIPSTTANVTLNWHFKVKALKLVETIHKHFTAKILHEHLLPVLKCWMHFGGDLLKDQATRALCWMMANNKVTKHEVATIHDIRSQFCRSQSCFLRKQYVTFMLLASEFFDCEQMKKYRFDETIAELFEDKTWIVRLFVCRVVKTFVLNGVIGYGSAKPILEKAAQDQVGDIAEVAENTLKYFLSEEAIRLLAQLDKPTETKVMYNSFKIKPGSTYRGRAASLELPSGSLDGFIAQRPRKQSVGVVNSSPRTVHIKEPGLKQESPGGPCILKNQPGV